MSALLIKTIKIVKKYSIVISSITQQEMTSDQKNGTDSRGFTPLYLLTLISIGYPKAF